MPGFLRSLRAFGLVWATCAVVYVATLGARVQGPSTDNHFVHLADSFLHGQLHVIGDRAPGHNDWARFNDRWYVAFPPLPAVVIAPAVAIWGTATWDRLFWALLAGLGPAAFYSLLRRLRDEGHSQLTHRDDLALTALLAFGSVYYFTAVQGTVWFAAHVVAVPLTAWYVTTSLDPSRNAAQPWLAGLCLGLLSLTRPTTVLLAPLFALTSLQAAGYGHVAGQHLLSGLRTVDRGKLLRLWLAFAVPVVVCLLVSFWLNHARFGDPFEVGYRYLQIRWQPRIEKWGLFNYHYLGRNLAVMVASLPWLSNAAPFVRISRHGLALWVTTPQTLLALWPKRSSLLSLGLAVSVALVALMNLCYQNSGWVQFGYRFSLDYAVPLFALVAVTRTRFGWGFYALLLWALVVNTFGAVTFDRMPQFYDTDLSQRVIFQPD